MSSKSPESGIHITRKFALTALLATVTAGAAGMAANATGEGAMGFALGTGLLTAVSALDTAREIGHDYSRKGLNFTLLAGAGAVWSLGALDISTFHHFNPHFESGLMLPATITAIANTGLLVGKSVLHKK